MIPADARSPKANRRTSLSRVHLFVAFAFTVMADPVSSVAYAIEAARRHLGDDATTLFVTMAVVVLIIVVISATYHQLIGRFPSGGGGPEAVASAFGEGWAFLPLGALLVDFTLTVAVSCAAGAAALIAFVPELAGERVYLALGLTAAVAAGVLAGHRGRVGFAIATQAFLLLAVVVFIAGLRAEPATGAGLQDSQPLFGDLALLPMLLALPLGMALATGVEAPSNAVAQLPQLDDRSRTRFGRLTLWLMVAIVGFLTLAFCRACDEAGAGAAGVGLDHARRHRSSSRRRQRPLRRLPGRERTVAAGGGGLLLPGRVRRAEGAGAPARRRRRPASGAVRASEPVPGPRVGRGLRARRLGGC